MVSATLEGDRGEHRTDLSGVAVCVSGTLYSILETLLQYLAMLLLSKLSCSLGGAHLQLGTNGREPLCEPVRQRRPVRIQGRDFWEGA